jgi:hypothetical protein
MPATEANHVAMPAVASVTRPHTAPQSICPTCVPSQVAKSTAWVPSHVPKPVAMLTACAQTPDQSIPETCVASQEAKSTVWVPSQVANPEAIEDACAQAPAQSICETAFPIHPAICPARDAASPSNPRIAPPMSPPCA